jgi:murein DD-endopeptidase MepM/ murein hydrolase activator NlpD
LKNEIGHLIGRLVVSAGLCLAGIWPANFALAQDQPQLRTQLHGEAVQGGLIIGQTEPGAVIRLGENRIPVGQGGVFAFGFRRDAAATVALRIQYEDGSDEAISLNVRQREFDVQRIDGVAPRFVDPPAETQERIVQDRRDVSATRDIFSRTGKFLDGFDWPVRGPISGVFGSQRIFNGQPRAPHSGLDIAAPAGAPIVAPADGRVVLRGDLYFSGNTLILDHGLGVTTTYLHMDRINVADGQEVRRGDQLGTVGATGRVTGPHLHWGLNWFGVRLDPALVLER